MDCGYKRKLDCIVDTMDVIVGDSYPLSYVDRSILDQNKRMRLSVQVDTGICQDDLESSSSHQLSTSEDSWSLIRNSAIRSCNPDMDFDSDCKSINDRDDDTYEDLPSTSEVINSLRKVILWMSAQGDHNTDYIQYLGEVERYALSKQLDIVQQRKITEYFLKQNQP